MARRDGAFGNCICVDNVEIDFTAQYKDLFLLLYSDILWVIKTERKSYEIPISIAWDQWGTGMEFYRASALLALLDILPASGKINTQIIQRTLQTFSVGEVEIDSVVEKAGDKWNDLNHVLDRAINRSKRSKKSMETRRVRNATKRLSLEKSLSSAKPARESVAAEMVETVLINNSIFTSEPLNDNSVIFDPKIDDVDVNIPIANLIPKKHLEAYRLNFPAMTNLEILGDYYLYKRETSLVSKILTNIQSIPSKLAHWVWKQRLHVIRTRYSYEDKGMYTRTSFNNVTPATRDVK